MDGGFGEEVSDAMVSYVNSSLILASNHSLVASGKCDYVDYEYLMKFRLSSDSLYDL